MSIDYAEAARLLKLGRRAEQRGKALQGCFTALLTKLVQDLMTAWLFMLAVGVAHAEWIPQLPTIGLWWALLLVVLTRALFTGYAKTQDKRS